MTTELKLQFENIGPHEKLEITLVPGVNILTGRNGAGKSEATAAAVRALGGTESVSKLDGSPWGTVAVDGAVLLRVGGRTTRVGSPSVELANGSMLGTLIDPKVADVEAADAARVKAVLAMCPVPMTREMAAEIAGGEDCPLVGVTVLAQAEVAKKDLQARARVAEVVAIRAATAAAFARARMADAKGKVLDVPLDGEPDALKAKDRARAAHGHAWQQKTKAEARAAMEAKQAAIRSVLGDEPDVTGPQDDVKDLKIKEAEATAAVTAAVAVHASIKEALTNGMTAVETAFAAHRAWVHQREILDSPVTGPTLEEAAEAAKAAEDADAFAAAVEMLEAYRKDETAALGFDAEAERSESDAKRLRAVADGIPDRLGAIMARAAGVALKMKGGRLYATLDGRDTLWEERLSNGQKVAIALQIALKAFPHRVIPLAPASWAALQPSVKAEVAVRASAAGIMLITEEPSDDDSVTVRRM